jgi:SNF2 family DNA or RNA helicase
VIQVTNTKPCKIVYSLYQHEYLGYLFEPHIVQLTDTGTFSLAHRKLFSVNADEFSDYLEDEDYKLIRLLEQCDQEFIVKKYSKKPIRPTEFFLNHYNDQVHSLVRPNIERRISEGIEMMAGKNIFVMGKEGNPVWKKIEISNEPASVLFHFRRSDLNTRYFPTIKHMDHRIEFMYKDAKIISESPAWMLLNGFLMRFNGNIDGKKLVPFLNKRYIEIPRSSEPTYFEKFIGPLIEKYDVNAQGFDIVTEQFRAQPIIKVEQSWNNQVQILLFFKYGEYLFPYKSEKKVSVKLEKQQDNYVFHRVRRSVDWEKGRADVLQGLGLLPSDGSSFSLGLNGNFSSLEHEEQAMVLFEWINENSAMLESNGFEISQENRDKKIHIGDTSIDIEFKENADWFDVQAVVRFGKFEIPFISLKNYILNDKREFPLPNGEIAIIPERWFTQFNNLFELAIGNEEIRLKKHHFGLVKEFEEGNIAKVSLTRKLELITTFGDMDDFPLPANFKGTLRPYQRAGYNWFHFLKDNRFGGCLADDMGLGKTIQTLALLLKMKENGNTQPNLIVMPTSLIYNWENEAKKFAPDLTVFHHIGTNREKNVEQFLGYDIILTTYGTVRLDADFMKELEFHYVILDESQVIKNPTSKIAKAVKKLWASNKLILSGTPVENTVVDLWSQMSFINPGLLGGITYFKNNFALPIEKKKDQEVADKLQRMIKPFILRRTKKQVASDLPEKQEQVYYCNMTEEQEEYYDEVKSYYRNEILKVISTEGVQKSKISLLQGLTKLRQAANHPKLAKEDYFGESGKFRDVMETLSNAIQEGHKILIFSQFVKHLQLFKNEFDKQKYNYSYLDGSTKNRQKVVDEFQSDDDIRIFLISLKAGGVGLNLTEADFVFILDPWWNPAVELQAIDRTHRIGQKKNVFIYKFISKNTVEEKILNLQSQKLRIANSLITTEDSFIKSLTEEDIRAILT